MRRHLRNYNYQQSPSNLKIYFLQQIPSNSIQIKLSVKNKTTFFFIILHKQFDTKQKIRNTKMQIYKIKKHLRSKSDGKVANFKHFSTIGFKQSYFSKKKEGLNVSKRMKALVESSREQNLLKDINAVKNTGQNQISFALDFIQTPNLKKNEHPNLDCQDAVFKKLNKFCLSKSNIQNPFDKIKNGSEDLKETTKYNEEKMRFEHLQNQARNLLVESRRQNQRSRSFSLFDKNNSDYKKCEEVYQKIAFEMQLENTNALHSPNEIIRNMLQKKLYNSKVKTYQKILEIDPILPWPNKILTNSQISLGLQRSVFSRELQLIQRAQQQIQQKNRKNQSLSKQYGRLLQIQFQKTLFFLSRKRKLCQRR